MHKPHEEIHLTKTFMLLHKTKQSKTKQKKKHIFKTTKRFILSTIFKLFWTTQKEVDLLFLFTELNKLVYLSIVAKFLNKMLANNINNDNSCNEYSTL